MGCAEWQRAGGPQTVYSTSGTGDRGTVVCRVVARAGTMGATTVAGGCRMVVTTVVGAHDGGDPRVPRPGTTSAVAPPHPPYTGPHGIRQHARVAAPPHPPPDGPRRGLLGPPLAHPPRGKSPQGTREQARVAAPRHTPPHAPEWAAVGPTRAHPPFHWRTRERGTRPGPIPPRRSIRTGHVARSSHTGPPPTPSTATGGTAAFPECHAQTPQTLPARGSRGPFHTVRVPTLHRREAVHP